MRSAHEPRGIRRRRQRPIEVGEPALDLRHHRLVIDRAGGSHHHVGRAVVAREVGRKLAAVERAHGLARPQDRAADRLVRKRRLLQPLEHQIVGRILGGADLLHDHVLLALQLLRIERRIGQDVGENVERERHVGREHARVISRALDAGGGVKVAADRLDLLGDLPGGSPAGALEGHMLQEMRDAVLVRPLVAAATAGPDAERGGLQMRHGVGHDRETRRKTRDFDAHAAAPCAARLNDKIWCSIAA